VPETSFVKVHPNANRPVPPVREKSSNLANETNPEILEDSTPWHDVMMQHAKGHP
jgi:hypothetical protein